MIPVLHAPAGQQPCRLPDYQIGERESLLPRLKNKHLEELLGKASRTSSTEANKKFLNLEQVYLTVGK